MIFCIVMVEFYSYESSDDYKFSSLTFCAVFRSNKLIDSFELVTKSNMKSVSLEQKIMQLQISLRYDLVTYGVTYYAPLQKCTVNSR